MERGAMGEGHHKIDERHKGLRTSFPPTYKCTCTKAKWAAPSQDGTKPTKAKPPRHKGS